MSFPWFVSAMIHLPLGPLRLIRHQTPNPTNPHFTPACHKGAITKLTGCATYGSGTGPRHLCHRAQCACPKQVNYFSSVNWIHQLPFNTVDP